MVGFNRRFDPHFAAVRKAIDDGTIGTVEMVTITSRDPGPPPLDYIKRSGGIFRDMTIHDFDMARFLLGEEPVAVSAHASVLVDKTIGEAGDFDSVSVILDNRVRQAVPSISNSRRATYGYDQRIEVHGSKGMVSAENQRAGVDRGGQRQGLYAPAAARLLHDPLHRGLSPEIAAFIAALEAGKPMSPVRRRRPQGAAHRRRRRCLAEGGARRRGRLTCAAHSSLPASPCRLAGLAAWCRCGRKTSRGPMQPWR